MNVFIRQLTGVRFVAAFWVLTYHLQGPLNTLGLNHIPMVSDFFRVGRLGVDLFFALSGFLLWRGHAASVRGLRRTPARLGLSPVRPGPSPARPGGWARSG